MLERDYRLTNIIPQSHSSNTVNKCIAPRLLYQSKPEFVSLSVTKYKSIDLTFSLPIIEIGFGVYKWDVAYSLR